MAEKPGPRYVAPLAEALAGGCTYAEAARRAGVSPRTVHRRRADPEFQRTVQVLRGEMVGRAAGALAGAATDAVETLRELLKDDAPSVRLGAARAILDQLVKVRDAEEMEARIAALEARAAEPPAPAFRVPSFGVVE